MIPEKKEQMLIKVYMYICDIYDTELKYYCQRYSNNSNSAFTDREILTIYLFAGHCRQYFLIKQIHTFAKEYLLSWFPKLPSYQTFNYRLNRLSEALKILSERLIELFRPADCDVNTSIVDSMPIITCAATRKRKVAREITAKGYCPFMFGRFFCYSLFTFSSLYFFALFYGSGKSTFLKSPPLCITMIARIKLSNSMPIRLTAVL